MKLASEAELQQNLDPGSRGETFAGWLADRIGRRVAFLAMLVQGAVFLTARIYSESHLWVWILGLGWGFGLLGFWAPSVVLTAEVFPTRIRGVANGVVCAIDFFVGLGSDRRWR